MKRTGRKQEWSLTMFAFGTVVFFPPIIGLFDKPVLAFGLPLAFLVLFGAWVVLILGIWLGARPSGLRGAREVMLERLDPEALTPPAHEQKMQPSNPEKEG